MFPEVDTYLQVKHPDLDFGLLALLNFFDSCPGIMSGNGLFLRVYSGVFLEEEVYESSEALLFSSAETSCLSQAQDSPVVPWHFNLMSSSDSLARKNVSRKGKAREVLIGIMIDCLCGSDVIRSCLAAPVPNLTWGLGNISALCLLCFTF